MLNNMSDFVRIKKKGFADFQSDRCYMASSHQDYVMSLE
ncbi:hypothetical protein LEP1GSC070_1605 [Leptospira santarosai str. AIM]|nr:hypothetical protein LEP1GSC070_1605 [Leptospira santarosai str. AIM]EPG83111.1 hypothetical protein LEP1GSC048_0255 [Leptospira santarosai serovar Shermani str. 1342KT]